MDTPLLGPPKPYSKVEMVRIFVSGLTVPPLTAYGLFPHFKGRKKGQKGRQGADRALTVSG